MRHDDKTIDSIRTHISIEYARRLQQLPFILAPSDFEDVNDDNPSYPKYYLLSHEETINTIPFTEFTFFINTASTYLHVIYEGNCKWTLHMMPALSKITNKRNHKVYSKFAYTICTSIIESVKRTKDFNEEEKRQIRNDNTRGNIDYSETSLGIEHTLEQFWYQKGKQLKVPEEEKRPEGMFDMFDEQANFLFSYFGYVASQHLIKVETEQIQKERKKSSFLKQHPHAKCHYIYLYINI